MHGLRIGEVARQAGVNVETLRYYERAGLVDAPPRTASGYRAYPEATVSRIRFIRQAKALGFSLQEIADLLSLRVSPTASRAEIKARAWAKIADIEDIRMPVRPDGPGKDLLICNADHTHLNGQPIVLAGEAAQQQKLSPGYLRLPDGGVHVHQSAPREPVFLQDLPQMFALDDPIRAESVHGANHHVGEASLKPIHPGIIAQPVKVEDAQSLPIGRIRDGRRCPHLGRGRGRHGTHQQHQEAGDRDSYAS